MKLIILLAAVSLAQAAKLDRVYLPPNAQTSAGSDKFLQTPHQSFNGARSQNINDYTSAITSGNDYAQNAYSGYEARPERAQAAFERNAAILRQDNSNDGETYSYAYETENGIYAEESGVATNGVQAQGGYSYTGDDGQVYTVRYTADENGFVPQGDHLPTSPPIPEEIQRSLDQNAREEAAGIYDDGSYNEGKYSAAGNSQQQYNSNAQPINYNDDSVITSSAINNGARSNANSVEKTYLPPFAQGNNDQMNRNYNSNGARLNGNSVEKTYLPPFAQRSSNQISRNYNSNANIPSVANNAARLNGNSVEKTYLPPFAQRSSNQINRNYNGNAIIPSVANNVARLNSNSVEKTYLPPFSQRSNNQSNDNSPAINNGASLNNNAPEKTYLPPLAQRNIQRNGNYNARNGYKY